MIQRILEASKYQGAAENAWEHWKRFMKPKEKALQRLALNKATPKYSDAPPMFLLFAKGFITQLIPLMKVRKGEWKWDIQAVIDSYDRMFKAHDDDGYRLQSKVPLEKQLADSRMGEHAQNLAEWLVYFAKKLQDQFGVGKTKPVRLRRQMTRRSEAF